MAKPTKASDLRGLSEEELNAEVYKCKRALFDLRVAQRTRQAYKSSEFGWNSRKIAQLLTIKRERELVEGISKRESRRKDKKEKLALGFGNF
ncbi:hypothetical protein WJX81_000253 [Elliptochloris bilobata]|uniref:Large ribosomal subunit protein uL29c n=1 Tax=Elliptochloris bilobata TaxID=381761 RepID=A0AAW1S7H2_9CHLO